MSRLTLLIDGDMLVYRYGYATQVTKYFIDGTKVVRGNMRDAKVCIDNFIDKTTFLFEKALGLTTKDIDVKIVLSTSGGYNWRTKFDPRYKMNRVVLEKPVDYAKIRDWLFSIGAIDAGQGIEADDWLGIEATKNPNAVIVSADKDFFGVPGALFFHMSSQRIYRATPSQALCFHLFQALAGDRVDGYYGVSFLGKSKVRRLMRTMVGKTVKEAYIAIIEVLAKRKKGSPVKDFARCLRVSTILDSTGRVGAAKLFDYPDHVIEYYAPYIDPDMDTCGWTLDEWAKLREV